MGSFRKMGITRSSLHKRRNTGGKKTIPFKKRKHALGRPMAGTRIGQKRIRTLRGRGANMKFRALRLDTGNFSWGSEVCTRKARILDVVYNASNNELVRTKTLVKGAIVQIDATPFKNYYVKHTGVELGKKDKKTRSSKEEEAAQASKHVLAKLKHRAAATTIDPNVEHQF